MTIEEIKATQGTGTRNQDTPNRNEENDNSIVPPPSTATRRSSDTNILKIVEKRIRDGRHQDREDNQAESGSDTGSTSPSALPPHLTTSTTATDTDYLDNLTLQKVVQASLGTCGPSARSPEEERAGKSDKKAPRVLSQPSEATNLCSLRTPEQQFAKASGTSAEKATGKEGAGPFRSVENFPPPNLRRSDLVVEGEDHQPGAYQGTPGEAPVRVDRPCDYSMILGAHVLDQSGLTDTSSGGPPDMILTDQNQGDLEEGTGTLPEPEEQRPSDLTDPTSKGLTVATLVQDGSSQFLPLPIAKEYGSKEIGRQDATEEETALQKKQKCTRRFFAAATVVVIITVVLLLVFLLSPDTESSSETMPPTPPEETASPTLSIEDYVLSLLPASTVRILHLAQQHAPQHKAYHWILGDPNLLYYSTERLQQRYALATFFYSTAGPTWTNSTNWMSYAKHECAWFHRNYFEDVEMYMTSSSAHTFKLMYNSDTYPCSQNNTGSFEHLWIYRNELEGRLPMEELYLLTSLKSMALFGNQLEITLSSELGLLRSLEGIEFSSLDVDGTIPSEIGLLTNLKAILASSNQITGTIPTEYGLLHQLEYSMLSKNQLSGSLPTQLGMMSSLAWLYLYGNAMTGSIPSVLGQVTTFEFLNMYTNQLTGPLPTEIGQLTRMNLMALSDNFLTGDLPSELGRLTNIKQGLSLNRNEFVGTIPTEMGAITGITGTITGSGTYGLGLGGNRLTGTLPSELGRLSLLARLYVEDNQLTGLLPSELGRMTSMGTLRAQNNQFIGAVPEETRMVLQALETSNAEDLVWSVLDNMEWDVSGNTLLSGTVPDFLCDALVFDCSDLLCGCDCACLG